MNDHYSPLHQYRISQPLAYFWPQQTLPDKLDMDSPAIMTMTDFRQVPPILIEPNVSIDWALLRMKREDVRLFLVVNHLEHVLGLITTTDIMGDKPLRLSQATGLRHKDIFVRDAMTSCTAFDVIEMTDVLKSSVGNVLETLKRTGRKHALVVDTLENGRTAIRGLFSSNQLSQQLNIKFDPIEIARTFSEVEVVINHPNL